MKLTAKGSRRRWGSNLLASLIGVALIAFAVFSLVYRVNPLYGIPAYVISAASALIFGLVLLAWVVSDWQEWIGNETVNMVVGVVAALIAIITFAKEIENGPRPEAPEVARRATN